MTEVAEFIGQLEENRRILAVYYSNNADQSEFSVLEECINQFHEVIQNFKKLKEEIVSEHIDIREYSNYIFLSINIKKISELVDIYRSNPESDGKYLIREIEFHIASLSNSVLKIINEISFLKNESNLLTAKNKILKIESTIEGLKNKDIHQIFDEDSKKFNNIATIYEFAFYILLILVAFYLFGYHFEFKTSFLTLIFAEHFDYSNKTEFYIQKISLIILSSTLAAFFLKRTYMNRRLADEAYRTAKELDALPRYMEGMPDEMKEKIRFDLAYKYFGNGIHHDSYTGGENLMHENIKANTEFMKVVKGVPSTTDESKADKDKNE